MVDLHRSHPYPPARQVVFPPEVIAEFRRELAGDPAPVLPLARPERKENR